MFVWQNDKENCFLSVKNFRYLANCAKLNKKFYDIAFRFEACAHIYIYVHVVYLRRAQLRDLLL